MKSQHRNMLKFARDLADFEADIQFEADYAEALAARASDPRVAYAAEMLTAIVGSYRALLAELTDGRDPADAIADAIRSYYIAADRIQLPGGKP